MFSLGTVSDTNFEEEGIDAEDQTHPEKGAHVLSRREGGGRFWKDSNAMYIYIYIMQLCNTIDDSQHQNIPLDKSPQHNLKLDQCE